MNPATLPKRPDLAEIVPLSSSPDGQLNSFCMRCDAKEQSMHYAACLWRQGVLSKPDVRYPTDWASCKDAAGQGNCVALIMRKEEIAAEQSIYFRKALRDSHAIAEPKRSWHSSAYEKVKSVVASVADSVASVTRPAPPAPSKPRDVFEAMGGTGSYADAISSMVATGAHRDGPAPAPTAAPAPAPTAMPGESPLAMARRIAAARAAASQV